MVENSVIEIENGAISYDLQLSKLKPLLDECHYRWLNNTGFHAAFAISIRYFATILIEISPSIPD